MLNFFKTNTYFIV